MTRARGPAAAEARFDRWAALALAAALSFAVLAAYVTLGVLAQPSDGWQISGISQDTRLARFIGDRSTPLRADDVILAVNGLNVDAETGSWLVRASLPAWQVGGTVSYTLRRAGQVLIVPVELHALDQASRLRALAHSLSDSPGELSWPLIALVVFGLRPGSRAARLLLIMMISHFASVKLGVAALGVSLNFAPPAMFYGNLLVNHFGIGLFWPCLIWLVLSFPLPVFPLTRWPRLTPVLLFGLTGGGLLLSALSGNVLPATLALVGELLLLLLALLLAVVNAARHTGEPVARAQVAWICLGLGVSLGLNLLVYLLYYFQLLPPVVPTWASSVIALVLPLCLAIAILRYRLFDIDLILRRTLLYSLLTALLAAVYLVSVVLLQNVFIALTGAARSELVTVLSTLAIAALFVPLRARLQSFIDRRFFRRKYDAARILAGFGASARDGVDLDGLTERLVDVVDETMQPQSVSVWLAPHER